MQNCYFQHILPNLGEHLDPDCESEFVQILDYFKDTPKGVYVDVGANVPKKNSQTYYLEELGWTGVLVEPLPMCADLCRKERPGSVVFNNACTSAEKAGPLKLYATGDCDVMASLEKNIDDLYVKYEETVDVEAVTLDLILEKTLFTEVDFVSIDTEGTEMDVLMGFTIDRYRPKLILLEDKMYNLDKYRYLKRKGYKLVRRTNANNWYVPVGVSFKVPFAEKLRLFRKTRSFWSLIARVKRSWDHFRHH